MNKKQVIRIIVFVVLASLIFGFFTILLQINNGRDVLGTYGFYLEPENSIDAVIVGPSQIYTSYYPAYAYKLHGYTSYTIATSAMPGSVYITATKEVNERQKPQLYVYDIGGFAYKDLAAEANVRKYIDNIPMLSKNRLEAIEKLVPEEERDSYYFPFIKYHSTYNQIITASKVLKDEIDQSRRGYSLLKNFTTTGSVGNYTTKYFKRDQNVDITNQGLDYLKELLDYLKETKTQNVLFATFPDDINRTETKSSLKAHEMIASYGYDYVNFSDYKDEMNIDRKKDFYNANHVNIRGAKKVTECVSDFLFETYNLNTTHSEEVTKEWDDCASYVDKVFDLSEQRLQAYEKSGDTKEGHQYYMESEMFSNDGLPKK
ncbi:MAG: hypothetical protein KBS62_02240 [Oscillospiraceae bacterium]|nr:hypothetical protein [Candidatus Ruminococcus equi]